MKLLIVSDHYPIAPRTKNLISDLKGMGIDTYVFAWNRNSIPVSEDNIRTFNQQIGYGNRLKKLFSIIPFRSQLKKYVNEIDPDIIQPIDYEMLQVVMKIGLSNKNCKIIYEVFDIKFFNNKIINKYREITELNSIKKVEGVVLASPFFNQYYKIKNPLILENKIKVPKEVDTLNKSEKLNCFKQSPRNKLNLAFVGTVRYYEIMINLIDAVKDLEINLFIIGSGPDAEELKQYSKKSQTTNVFFSGRYETEDLPQIYSDIDVIWAAYPSNDLNVYYAVSNKFYESQYFAKKIIVSKNTLLGDYVEEKNLGYTVDPYSKESIMESLMHIQLPKENHDISLHETKYVWSSQLEKVIKFYGEIK